MGDLQAQSTAVLQRETLAVDLAEALLPTGLSTYHARRGATATGGIDARRADMPEAVVGQHRRTDSRGLFDTDAQGQARQHLGTGRVSEGVGLSNLESREADRFLRLWG